MKYRWGKFTTTKSTSVCTSGAGRAPDCKFLSAGNLVNKRYFETQNYGDSRISPTAGLVPRIHARPGYPFTVTAGVTFRFLSHS